VVKLAPNLALALLLTGCAAGPRAGAPPLLRPTVTEPVWPSVAACLAATRAALPGSEAANRGCVRIDVENAMSPIFVLQSLVIDVDGLRLYAREESTHERGELDLVSRFTVGLGQMAPGPHEVRLSASLVPNSLREPSLAGYRWQLCAKHVFTAAPGGGLNLTAQLHEIRGEQRPPEQWLAIRYLENGAETASLWEPVVAFPEDHGCPRSPSR
jgi:hypothetical protein